MRPPRRHRSAERVPRPQSSRVRPGAAAVEFAVVLPLIFLLLLGTWEVARLVQVHAILSNAVREGARLAAQGQTINLTGAYTQILVSDTDPNTPDVTSAVMNYVRHADPYYRGGTGISTDGMTVTFTFVDSAGNPVASPTQPWQGTKGQRFRVTATLPYSNFRWTTLNLLGVKSISATADWASMIDDPFQVNTTLPTWDPLP
ncbi:MAG TPA: TadE family protein [Gemmataceae bacterium]|jgi:Flp pilus assembly protein TadG